jgi:hypothetical protein
LKVVEAPPILNITDVAGEKEELVFRISPVTPRTQVLAIVSRFLPSYSPLKSLSKNITLETGNVSENDPKALRHSKATYLSDRVLSDEHQYVLNRAREETLPGNMLRKPTFLLNPCVRCYLESESFVTKR